jgi:hypothetical protein
MLHPLGSYATGLRDHLQHSIKSYSSNARRENRK